MMGKGGRNRRIRRGRRIGGKGEEKQRKDGKGEEGTGKEEAGKQRGKENKRERITRKRENKDEK